MNHEPDSLDTIVETLVKKLNEIEASFTGNPKTFHMLPKIDDTPITQNPNPQKPREDDTHLNNAILAADAILDSLKELHAVQEKGQNQIRQQLTIYFTSLHDALEDLKRYRESHNQ
jgi:hypothetical protein